MAAEVMHPSVVDPVTGETDPFYIRTPTSLADDRHLVLKQGETFIVLDRRGDIRPGVLMEPETSKQTEELVIHQIVRLLGATLPLPAIATVQAPVFHSHSFSMFLKLAGSPTVEQIEERLRDSHGTITVHRDTGKAVSPITIVGSDSVRR